MANKDSVKLANDISNKYVNSLHTKIDNKIWVMLANLSSKLANKDSVKLAIVNKKLANKDDEQR